MNKKEVMAMIAEGDKVEIICIRPPLQNRIYKANGKKIRSDLGQSLLDNCPSGIIEKENLSMYTSVLACVYN